MDRGGDRKSLPEPLLDRGARCVIRSTGKRTVVDRHVTEVAGRCRLRHQARMVKIQDGQEKSYALRYRAEPVRLPGRSEKLWLVVIAGLGGGLSCCSPTLRCEPGTRNRSGGSCQST